MSSAARSVWLPFRKAHPGAEVRLFCFPYAGAGAQVFRSWAEQLPSWIEVCAVQIPGRETRLREAPFTQLAPLVAAIATALEPLLDRPYAFFGHSMGALVAFELARELRRRARPEPAHLFLSGRGPRHGAASPPIHALPDGDFVAELRRLGGTPPELLQHDGLMQMLLPTLRADFAIVEGYRAAPERPLRVPITALGGIADGSVPNERLAAWREHTERELVLRLLPGNHFFIHTARPLVLDVVTHQLKAGVHRGASVEHERAAGSPEVES